MFLNYAYVKNQTLRKRSFQLIEILEWGCRAIKYLFATKDPYQIVNHNKQYLISKNKK